MTKQKTLVHRYICQYGKLANICMFYFQETAGTAMMVHTAGFYIGNTDNAIWAQRSTAFHEKTKQKAPTKVKGTLSTPKMQYTDIVRGPMCTQLNAIMERVAVEQRYIYLCMAQIFFQQLFWQQKRSWSYILYTQDHLRQCIQEGNH